MKRYCVLLDNHIIIKACSPRQLRSEIKKTQSLLFMPARAIRFWKEYEK